MESIFFLNDPNWQKSFDFRQGLSQSLVLSEPTMVQIIPIMTIYRRDGVSHKKSFQGKLWQYISRE